MENVNIGDRISMDRSTADVLIDMGVAVEVECLGGFVLVERVA